MEDNKIQEQPVVEETKKEDGNAELQTNEENGVKTYSKEEYDKAVKEAFEKGRKNGNAEAERKETKKANEEATAENEQLKADNKVLKDELEALKQTVKMDALGIVKDKQIALATLIRADGKEVTEETIEEYATIYPEWKKAEITKGVEDLGQEKEDEVAEDEELKDLNAYRARKGLPPVKNLPKKK